MVGLPCSSDSKESACNTEGSGLIPGLGRSCGEGNGNSLQYSCLENPIDRGAWWATGHGVAELDTTGQLTLHYTVVERASQVALVVKNLPANAGDVKEWVPSLGRKDPWRNV